MVLGGQMDYPIAHPQPYSTAYGQPGGYGSGYSQVQPYQQTNLGGYPYMEQTNLGGYPYMGYGNQEDCGSDNSSSMQQARLYPNSVLPLPSKHHMVAPPEGYNKHSYDHGIKPHGYDKPYGSSHGYEKPSKNDYYGNNTHGGYDEPSNGGHGGYDKHSNGGYDNHSNGGHGGYDKHSSGGYDNHSNGGHGGYDKHSNGGYDNHSNGGHGGYGNGKYPSHGANMVETMAYNYYSSNGQEKKSHNWILKGLDD